MTHSLNWGIIGTGFIAPRLVEGLRQVPGANFYSVASRSAARAAEFAAQHGAQKHYASTEAFASDPALDVAIVATPHPNHHADTLLCLNAGKHVLCEKPMAMNAGQVEEMIAAAQANNRFLMEAMWMWFLPATVKTRALIAAGEIGEPRLLTADIGSRVPYNPQTRVYNLAAGGGALLDRGSYPLALALYLFGNPESLTGRAVFGPSGVDEQFASVLRYAGGLLAVGTSNICAPSGCEAVISGTTAHLQMHRRWWYSERLSLHYPDGHARTFDVPLAGSGYKHEIAHVMQCIAAGKLESDVVTWQASRDLSAMLDALRADSGLRYPAD